MPSALEPLRRLVPPPARTPPSVDWRQIERRLGTRLPADYKALVETYGPGAFDDFVSVLQPACANPFLDLLTQREERLDALAAVGDETYQVDALLPWAFTDNGDVCYWITDRGTEPDEWPVTVNESRGPEWHEFAGTATEFLVAVLSGQRACAVFPDDFPSEQPDFRIATTV